MAATLSFTTKEIKPILAHLEKYPSLPTPSQYEKARHQVGGAQVTVYTSGKIVVQAKSKDVEHAVKEKLVSWLENDSDERVFGIDEVGRGEKTGPLVVGGVLGQRNALRGLRDSKKTSNIAKHYTEATRHALMDMRVSVNARMVDELRKKGLTMNDIQAEIALAFHQLKEKFSPESMTLMDGKPLRKGMKGIVFQEKADDIEPSVSAASIIAKHTRNESGDTDERKTWKSKSD
jgi:ribonuclease HII